MSNEVTSLTSVAQHFGVSAHQVRRWRERGCPALQERPYDLAEIETWRAGLETTRVEQRSEGASEVAMTTFRRWTRPAISVPAIASLLTAVLTWYLTIQSQKPSRIDLKQHELTDVLEKLSNLFVDHVSVSIDQIIRADASANAYPWGQAEVWASATPDETRMGGRVRNGANYSHNASVTDRSSIPTGKDEQTGERRRAGVGDIRPSAPKRNALISLDVAFYYEQARVLEDELHELGVESLSYLEYVMLAFGAAEIGRFDEAADYLAKAESQAEGIQKVLVLGIQGHFYYEHSRDSTDRKLAAEYYTRAIDGLEQQSSRLGNRFRADLLAAWAEDALLAGDVCVAQERADEAVRFYKSVPSARTQLNKFISKLRALENTLPIQPFVDSLIELPDEPRRTYEADARTDGNDQPNERESAERIQHVESLLKKAMDIVYRHNKELWRELHHLGTRGPQEDDSPPQGQEEEGNTADGSTNSDPDPPAPNDG